MDGLEDVAQPQIRVFGYRWIVLGIFCLFTVNNFVQFLEYTIISNVIQKYYKLDDTLLVDLSGLIYFIVYLIAFFPVSYLIEKYNMRVTAITSTALTLLGNVVKLFSTPQDKFYLVLLGQGLCGLAQVYMLSIPSKFAALWFGAEEVSTACAIALLGTQLGAALGSIIPTLMVKDGKDEDIQTDLMIMLIFHAVCSAVTLVIVLLFFRAKPNLPPSQSQANLIENNESNELWTATKKLARNKDFLIVLVVFGIANGLWNSFGIFFNNLYTTYFPDNGSDTGIIAAVAIICGGCIGSVVFGYTLDKTHKFKMTSLGVLLASSVTLILVLVTFLQKSRVGTFISVPAFGFFLASTLVIGFEYILEASYPTPESLGTSVLNAVIYVFAIITTLVIQQLAGAIGYQYSIVCAIVVLFLCSLLILCTSSRLRRRDANLQQQEVN